MIDVTWGAGHVKGKKYVKAFNDVYFLTDPEIFIFNHLSLDLQWQLIDEKISLEQFENQILIRPHFFKIGFSVSDVRSRLHDKEFRGFPKVYNFQDKNIIIQQAPLDKYLKSGTVQNFIIKSIDALDIAIINAGKWEYLKKEE